MDLFNTESKIEVRIVAAATARNIPLGGAFELLPLCNMNCRMCFLRLSPAQMKVQGRLRTPEEWLKIAGEAKEAGLLFLLLTGGEILLYPDFEYLYRELHKMGFYITLNTNGSLIDDRIADLFRENMPRRVNITLYGAGNATYAKLCGSPKGFTQTMKGIRLLQERNVPIKLNGSITAQNKEDLSELQTIAKELDIPIEIASYMFPCSRKGVCGFDYASRLTAGEAAKAWLQITEESMDKEKFDALMEQMAWGYENTEPAATACAPTDRVSSGGVPSRHAGEEITCRAGKSAFWLNWKGNMTPCVFMEEPGVPAFETGFSEAWAQINKHRPQMYLPAACTTCQRRPFCTVCGAAVLTETGDTHRRPDYVCTLTNEKLRLVHEKYHR